MVMQLFIQSSCCVFCWLILFLSLFNIKDSHSFRSGFFQNEKVACSSLSPPILSQSSLLSSSSSNLRSKCFIIYAGIKVGYHSGEKSGFRGWANPKHLKRKRAKAAEEWAKWIKTKRPQRKNICLRIRNPHEWTRIKQRRKMFSPWFNGTISASYQERLLQRYHADLATIPPNVMQFTKPSTSRRSVVMKPPSILPPIMLASLNITTAPTTTAGSKKKLIRSSSSS
jgi:hypothetical protein